ncbi:Carbohydrate kinase, FGGY [Coriobacterium glomerans PW2]|uniref:Carbohydrate kinase, FGGY n=1 Tax=Coriobacterium glomerans (strain ATCC 49209 / DSM 20642 / JCM 10262 / PW2) TaxID=700015 RepID=F2N7L0_CORGP|nr:FGGY-family carbohydrate kinase [Coriobacterium glomerans]AEB06826.1 Carbohydrate kinase, FGGY [Coriobacterium glomerans PW2]
MRYYMGIDVGTGESKGVIIDESCTIVAQKTLAHETQNPRPGWYQHDADAIWWGDFCQLSRELIAAAKIPAERIRCVGLSALGSDCVAVDADGAALAPAILYGIDARSAPQIKELIAEYGEDRARELIGHDPCSSDVSPKVLWYKENMPDIHDRAAKFLTASSFLCAKLTGRFTIDRYLAEDFLPMYDPVSWRVDSEHISRFCRSDQMAEVCSATDIAGSVTEIAAKATGLTKGTPVLVGTGDSGAEAISTGVCRPGDLMVQLGSTCYIICVTDHLINDSRLWPGSFIIPDQFAVCAGTNTAGSLTGWLGDELYRDAVASERTGGPNVFEAMASEAKRIPPGSEGLICLPYFAGERTPINDPDARGVFFGLTLRHTRAHMVRAALEGIAFSIAAHISILEHDHGLRINRIVAAGGGTKNPVWLQAISDACCKEVSTASVSIGASYGDALMAALADGACSSWNDLAARVGKGMTFEPDRAASALFTERKDLFDNLYRRNSDLMHALGSNRTS